LEERGKVVLLERANALSNSLVTLYTYSSLASLPQGERELEFFRGENEPFIRQRIASFHSQWLMVGDCFIPIKSGLVMTKKRDCMKNHSRPRMKYGHDQGVQVW
jgi:hypothetical protein